MTDATKEVADMGLDIERDEDLIRQEGRRSRNLRLAVAIFGLAGMVAGYAAATAFASRAQPATGLTPIFWAACTLVLVLSIAGGWLAWRSRPGAHQTRLLQVSGQRDRMHDQRARALFIVPIASLGVLPAAYQASSALLSGDGGLQDWALSIITSVTFPLLIIHILLSRGARKLSDVYDEELINTMRSRALGIGYLAAMVVMVGLFFLGLWRPRWAILATPAAMLLCATVPAWSFAWLNWRAGRDE